MFLSPTSIKQASLDPLVDDLAFYGCHNPPPHPVLGSVTGVGLRILQKTLLSGVLVNIKEGLSPM